MGKSIVAKESQAAIKLSIVVFSNILNLEKSIDVKEEQPSIIELILCKLWGPDSGKATDSNFEQD